MCIRDSSILSPGFFVSIDSTQRVNDVSHKYGQDISFSSRLVVLVSCVKAVAKRKYVNLSSTTGVLSSVFTLIELVLLAVYWVGRNGLGIEKLGGCAFDSGCGCCLQEGLVSTLFFFLTKQSLILS